VILLHVLFALVAILGDGATEGATKADLDKIVARAAPKAVPADPAKAAELLDAVEKDLESLATRAADADVESEARFQLASIQLRRSKTTAALATLRQAIAAAKGPEAKVSAMLMLAQVQQSTGDAAGAKATFEAFLKEFPNHEFAPRVARAAKLIEARERLQIGKPVPEIDEKDLDGKPFSTSALAGKVLLVDFGATWCEPWRRDLGALKSLHARLRDKGFEVLGVAMDGPDEKTLRRFLEQEKIAWPVFSDGRDWDDRIALAYGVETLPASVLVDRSGVVRFLNLPRAALEPAVQSLLAEKGAAKK
jgi:peroxiredoxin